MSKVLGCPHDLLLCWWYSSPTRARSTWRVPAGPNHTALSEAVEMQNLPARPCGGTEIEAGMREACLLAGWLGWWVERASDTTT